MGKIQVSLIFIILLFCTISCNNKVSNSTKEPANEELVITDEALLDSVQRRTFNYFWEGAEPVSGMAR
ncbi:MAG: beta-glucosidase, partial [Dysgonomonas sp.]